MLCLIKKLILLGVIIMSTIKHGLSIGLERSENDFFLSLKVVGKLTHDDYKTITPLLDSALTQVTDPKVNVLIDASELEGWELRAAWDDFKLGLKHNNEFHRIAIYGNQKWLAVSAKIADWFTSGEVQYFENLQDAVTWVQNNQ
jgi:hypothetical protein